MSATTHVGLWSPLDERWGSSHEVFNTLLEARVLIEQWRVHYNTVRPHSSLGYQPPAPEVVVSGAPILPPGRPGPTGSHQPSVTMLH